LAKKLKCPNVRNVRLLGCHNISGGNRGQELSIIDDSLPGSLLSTGRLPSNNKAGRICADTLYSSEVVYLDW
jgi:hypothetical protein